MIINKNISINVFLNFKIILFVIYLYGNCHEFEETRFRKFFIDLNLMTTYSSFVLFQAQNFLNRHRRHNADDSESVQSKPVKVYVGLWTYCARGRCSQMKKSLTPGNRISLRNMISTRENYLTRFWCTGEHMRLCQ